MGVAFILDLKFATYEVDIEREEKTMAIATNKPPVPFKRRHGTVSGLAK